MAEHALPRPGHPVQGQSFRALGRARGHRLPDYLWRYERPGAGFAGALYRSGRTGVQPRAAWRGPGSETSPRHTGVPVADYRLATEVCVAPIVAERVRGTGSASCRERVGKDV